MSIDASASIEAMRRQLDAAGEVVNWLSDSLGDLATMGAALLDVLAGGGTIWTCGNGGSATHAMHLAEELLGRYRTTRPPLAAACLHADPSALTCIANDFGYETVFSRAIEGLGRSGDALIVFSTSGNSPNILRAIETAQSMGIMVIGLLGRSGGDAAGQCDRSLIVPFEDSATIQEGHHLMLHLLCEMIDNAHAPE
ncbi:MAG: SIS domain-containing protein [Phycisphaerales bacterium]|nr:SIS domain-containing protein [Phycisphaerales bacterium]